MRESPRIGADVLIGAGARVVGRVQIGDGVAVGANAVCLCDAPPHSTVVGVPGRIIERDQMPDPMRHRPGHHIESSPSP
ncbi:hypothetical protein [Terrabacter sp. 2YAF2]|uniref:hypothetical protein n=1 Tax=Terrabacter sp. 2YAF2 TaxID=3233026 RepID=UPI003F9E973F